MTKREKLVSRFLSIPNDFHFDEAVTLLKYYGYLMEKPGKTSGSRVKFENRAGIKIILHRPHPNGILKIYQIKQLKDLLEL